MNAGSLSRIRVTGQFAPLVGILIGALGGGVYWLTVQAWPSSVAVILSMAATAPLTTEFRAAAATRLDLLSRVFCLLIKYNALMALSAAKLPFSVPANLPLALIMVCGYAASFGLLVSVMAVQPGNSGSKVGHAALAFALLIGFGPAVLLGVPGLVALAAAIVAGMILIALLRYKRIGASNDALDLTQLVTETCFYLGALASWRYV